MPVGYLAIDRWPHRPLDELFAPLTPAIQKDEQERGVWFDASGIRLQYGDEGRYGRAVLATIARAEGTGRIGIAATPWVARLAARLATPDEVIVVPEPETRAFLRPLPLEWLPLPSRIQERLRALGIVTIGQFADLPLQSLRRRFGADIALAHRLAHGDNPTPFRGRTPLAPLSAERALEPPVATQDALEPVFRSLCQQIADALAALAHAARSIQLELVEEADRTVSRFRRLPQPYWTAPDLFAVAWSLLTGITIVRPIVLLRLTVEEHAPAHASQPALFDDVPARTAERERLWQTAQRFAGGRVVRLLEHVPAAPLPELRWRVQGTRNLAAHPLHGEPVHLARRPSGWWLRLGERWIPIRRGGFYERLDLWWPVEHHRRTVWVELADGQRLLLTRDHLPSDGASERPTWRLVGRLD
ncbi:DNA polymerase Y family protein [Thermomicrobium sp.]